MRRHRDDGKLLQSWIAAQQFGRGEPIHFRHLQVHEHHIERRKLIAGGKDFNGFPTVVRHRHYRPGTLQQFGRDLLIHLVIFDQQDANSRRVMLRDISFARAMIFQSSDAEQIHECVI